MLELLVEGAASDGVDPQAEGGSDGGGCDDGALGHGVAGTAVDDSAPAGRGVAGTGKVVPGGSGGYI